MESAPRIQFANPSWSQWLGAVATNPTGAGTETPNIEYLDFGTVVAGANSDAKAVSLEFNSDFDDSVYGVKIWAPNNPNLTGHAWYYEAAMAALFPAGTLSTALTNGLPLPGRPQDSSWLPANMYDSTNKRVRNILFQLQTQVGAAAIKQNRDDDASIMQTICFFADMERKDRTNLNNVLSPTHPMFDIERNQLFMFSDVTLYMCDPTTAFYQVIAAIKEDTIDIDSSTERVKWEKGKPKATFIQALSTQKFEAKFKCDEMNPAVWAMAVDQTAVRNTAQHTVDIEFSSKTRPTIERAFMIEASTVGGYKVRYFIDRATLMTSGGYKPGENDFAGYEFTLSGLASGCDRKVARLSISDVPVESSCCLQARYIVT